MIRNRLTLHLSLGIQVGNLCSFNAEIDFDGSKLLEQYMERQDVVHMKEQFHRASQTSATDDFEAIMKAYGTEVVSLVGAEARTTFCIFV